MNTWIKQLTALILLVLTISATASAAQTVTYYHNDLLGSPIAATNANGDVIWRENYQAFGEKVKKDDTSQGNAIGFTGHVNDADIGLTYMQARYYDPILGRFLANDAVGFQESNPAMFNRYAYANNNPYTYIDPDGNMAFLVPVAIFLAKEAASMAASHVTGGLTDYLSVSKMGKKLLYKGIREANEQIAKRAVNKSVTKGTVQLSAKNSNKLGQQIGRWKREMGGQGGAKEFLKHASDLATEAKKAGTFVTGEVGQGAGALGKATIYRQGNEFLVEQGGNIMSYVPNPGKGGIVDEYVRLGGKL